MPHHDAVAWTVNYALQHMRDFLWAKSVDHLFPVLNSMDEVCHFAAALWHFVNSTDALKLFLQVVQAMRSETMLHLITEQLLCNPRTEQQYMCLKQTMEVQGTQSQLLNECVSEMRKLHCCLGAARHASCLKSILTEKMARRIKCATMASGRSSRTHPVDAVGISDPLHVFTEQCFTVWGRAILSPQQFFRMVQDEYSHDLLAECVGTKRLCTETDIHNVCIIFCGECCQEFELLNKIVRIVANDHQGDDVGIARFVGAIDRAIRSAHGDHEPGRCEICARGVGYKQLCARVFTLINNAASSGGFDWDNCTMCDFIRTQSPAIAGVIQCR